MTECEIHHKPLPCEDCKAEQQKKEELYNPNTCADMGDPGCSYPDCDGCEVSWDDDEEDDW